jgi:hypothetical protein
MRRGRSASNSRHNGRVSAPVARTPRLRSPLARAVFPVLGGLGIIAMIALSTWGVAAYISGGGATTNERLAPETFQVSSVESAAAQVERSGPILFPGLNTTTGERTIVLDHEGDDPERGWRLYFAYPVGSDTSCTVTQVQGTSEFVDCEGNSLDVTELSPPPPGVNPVVADGVLSIDLRGLGATDS